MTLWGKPVQVHMQNVDQVYVCTGLSSECDQTPVSHKMVHTYTTQEL